MIKGFNITRRMSRENNVAYMVCLKGFKNNVPESKM